MIVMPATDHANTKRAGCSMFSAIELRTNGASDRELVHLRRQYRIHLVKPVGGHAERIIEIEDVDSRKRFVS